MSRFLITFDEPDDPLPEIVELIQHRLEPSPVEEVTPGVLAVESDEQTVRAAVEAFVRIGWFPGDASGRGQSGFCLRRRRIICYAAYYLVQ